MRCGRGPAIIVIGRIKLLERFDEASVVSPPDQPSAENKNEAGASSTENKNEAAAASSTEQKPHDKDKKGDNVHAMIIFYYNYFFNCSS